MTRTSSFRIKSLLCLLALLAASCTGQKENADGYVFHVDATQQGDTIPNLVSNMNVWDMGTLFVSPQMKSAYNPFEFIEYIQLMTATGGNDQRDLFIHPRDHSVLDDYDFSRLIANCKGILSLGAKPHLKLGNIPGKFTSQYKEDTFGVNVYAPDDYDQYYAYIHAIIQALADTFGTEEVATWHFGVFTEYENRDWFQGIDGTPESAFTEYCKIYDYTVKAVTDVLGPDIYIGAHSMTVSEGLWDERLFIRHCAEGTNYADGGTGTHISYLSTSFYDIRPGVFTSGMPLSECITFLREAAESYGLTHLVYGVDEGRILGATPGHTESALYSRTVGFTWMAAYDARLYGQLLDCGGSYLSSWEYLSKDRFEGNPSISYHVASNVFRMKGLRRAEVISIHEGTARQAPASESESSTDEPGITPEVKVYAGTDPATGHITLMLYNFGNALDYDQEVDVHLDLKTTLKPGRHTLTIRKIDDDCNWFDEWTEDRQRLGITNDKYSWSPDDACVVARFITDKQARAQYNELEPTYAPNCVLTPIEQKVTIRRDGCLHIDCHVSPSTVWFLDIE